MSTIYDDLLVLVESIFGTSKNGVSDGGQMQVNCPNCWAEEGACDYKFNLEISLRKGKCNCWKCGEYSDLRGKLSKIIKIYGSETLAKQYWQYVKDIKNSRLYTFQFNDNDFENEDIGEEIKALPKCCEYINHSNYSHRYAIQYLSERNLGDDIIKKHNLSCTTWCDEIKMRNRIIIPSYDKFGNLNYFTGRNYDGYPKAEKYYNMPDVSKQLIIFNEQLIDWGGDVRLVEGPFDHLVVPNSTPLLGKSLDSTYLLYQEIFRKSNGTVTIWLDPDAIKNTKIIYKELNVGKMKGRIKYIPAIVGDSEKLDPSKIYEKEGYRGICRVLKTATMFDDFDLQIME